MRIPSTPRRATARSKPVHFTYVRAEPKEQPWEAYLAGPIWWGFLHMTRPSKPCVYELTGGQVECRFCCHPPVATVKGWVPLYRQVDGFACCVPVDETLRDDLDALKPFTRVVVGRMKGKGAMRYVRCALNQEPQWSSTLPERSAPADISSSLLTMWALPELHAFFGSASMPLTAGASDDDAQVAELLRHAEEQRAGKVNAVKGNDGGPLADVLGDVIGRAQRRGPPRPSANGNGHA